MFREIPKRRAIARIERPAGCHCLHWRTWLTSITPTSGGLSSGNNNHRIMDRGGPGLPGVAQFSFAGWLRFSLPRSPRRLHKHSLYRTRYGECLCFTVCSSCCSRLQDGRKARLVVSSSTWHQIILGCTMTPACARLRRNAVITGLCSPRAPLSRPLRDECALIQPKTRFKRACPP